VSASRIWVGGYTSDQNGMAEGIVRLGVAADGLLENHGVVVATDSPSYLTRSGDMIYAAGEGGQSVSAFRIHGDELLFSGTRDAAGELPCSLAVLGERAVLVAACYGDGTVDVHPLAADGTILKTSQSLRAEGRGPRPEQNRAHAHDCLPVDESTVLTADLGTDEVQVHSFDGELLTRIAAVALPAGSGPRDLVLHPSGRVWVLAELSCEVFVLRRDSDFEFTVESRVALPGAQAGDHASALSLSADGRFAYVGLRGSDQVAVLAVGANGAALTAVTSVDCGGGWPRHLVVDGPYLRVANQLTNSVATFRIGEDGIPVPASSLPVPSPTYLLLD
jgi:6-phosphogluconolactonase